MGLVVACGAVALLLSLASLGTGVSAAGSDVADAVMRGDAAAVRALLTQKADVNAKQADGATALHWAVYRADTAADGPVAAGGRRSTGRQSRRLHAAFTGGSEREPRHRGEPAESRRGSERTAVRGAKRRS